MNARWLIAALVAVPGAVQPGFADLSPHAQQSRSQVTYSTYIGGRDEEMATEVEVDPLGNLYVTGGSLSRDYPLTDVAPPRKGAGFGIAPVTKLSPEGSIVYSTFIEKSTFAQGLDVDTQGNAYVAGYSREGLPATADAYDTSYNGEDDAFIAKLNPVGHIEWATYLGGELPDIVTDVHVGATGDVYLTGLTFSKDFPVTDGAYDRTRPGSYDVFVSKLSADGSALLYSTFLGGRESERADSLTSEPVIEVDDVSHVYVGGSTSSKDFPTTPGAFDRELQRREAFVAQLSANGEQLLFSTFLGGQGADTVSDIDIDSEGRVHIVGNTLSSDFPVSSDAFDRRIGQVDRWDADGFVAQLSADGSSLEHATYLGGDDGDELAGIEVHRGGSVYVTGSGSINYPRTSDAFDPFELITDQHTRWARTDPLGDVVVTHLSADLSSLLYSTFIGGTGYELARDLELVEQEAILAGYTESHNFPTTPQAARATTKEPGAHNMFVSRLAPGGEPCTQVGAMESDIIEGTPANDLLCALAGDDRLAAGAGSDMVYGGVGTDALQGGAGYDVLLGQDGDDIIRGSDGPDSLYGAAGNDELRAGTGEDALYVGGREDQLLVGGIGDDLLIGASFYDRLVGGAGADVMLGRAGPDLLNGGGDNDELRGGNGRDRCSGGRGANDTSSCEQLIGAAQRPR